MTYCAAALTEQGIVFASDSRTNAGMDHIASYSKMNVFETPGERVIVILSAGNLATTQGVNSLLRMRMTGRGGKPAEEGILGVRHLYDAAVLVGETLREVVGRSEEGGARQHVDVNADFIVGGQVRGGAPRLFHVYSIGNFIEATPDTPYFQIGETKYGKPVIDRLVRYHSTLEHVAKCLVVSFDSTIRSNLSVGLPIDVLAYEKDALRVRLRRRFCEGDQYFEAVGRFWSEGISRAFRELPDLTWVNVSEDRCRR
jgi:putative proteasome-type protease